MSFLKKFFPTAHNKLTSTTKKRIRGSISLGCNVATTGIIGMYIDNLNNDFSIFIWGIVVVFGGATFVICNQLNLAKNAFDDYCEWNKIFLYLTMFLPFVLLILWWLSFILPKFLQNYCFINSKRYGQ